MGDLIRVGHSTHAGCGECPVSHACTGSSGRPVSGVRPRGWKPGGLMVITEEPTDVDRSRGVPLAGADGRLFEALCAAAGVSRDELWVTPAYLGALSRKQRKASKRDRGLVRQEAIFACIPRLEAEIEEAQPRVIVTFGVAGLEAATSHTVTKTTLKPFACPNPECIDEAKKPRRLRTLGLACASGDCAWRAVSDYEPGADPELLKAWAETVCVKHDGRCPDCDAKITRLRPKRLKCLECGGLRRRPVTVQAQSCAWSLHGRDGIVGAVFNTETTPSRWDEFGVRYIIPMYGMRYCLGPAERGGGQYAARVVVEHLQKAERLLHEDQRFKAEALVLEDADEIAAWLAAPRDFTSLDIETDSREGAYGANAVTCLGFADLAQTEALAIDTHSWDIDTKSAAFDAVQAFLEDPTHGKVLHGGVFDLVVLDRLWGVETQGVIGDTLVAHHGCYPDEEHGLGFVAHELTDAPPWKGGVVRRSWGRQGDKDSLSGYGDFAGLAHYNAQDTRATALVWDALTRPGGRVDEAKTRPVVKLDQRMSEIAVKMQLAGLHIDEERMRVVEEAHVRICDAELAKMRELVSRGEDWRPTGKDLQWALFANDGPCQLSPAGFTDSGAPSMDKATLNARIDTHAIIPSLLRWRKYDYALSHYLRGAGLERDAWGYIHPTWKVYGARTGRWSSSPNMQNWTKGDHKDELTNMRRMVVAPPGRTLVGADFSQLEMRVVAALSADEAFIARCLGADEHDKLNPEADPHSYVASLTFGQTFLDAGTERRKALREVAKRVFYGLQYGAGAETVLAAIYDGGYEGPPLSVQIIRATIATIFEQFPGIKAWREGSVKQVMAAREIRSPILGRRRVYPLGEVDTTICYNFPIQSGAADIVNMQMDVLEARLAREFPSADIFAQVHDAIYAECDEADAPQVARVFEESLNVELALIEGGPVMPFAASAKISNRWDEAA